MARPTDRASIDRLRRVTRAVVATMVLTFLVSLAFLGAALYDRSLSDARNLSVAVQQFALRAVVTADLLSVRVRDMVLERGTLDGLPQDESMHRTLIHLSRRLPEGSGMAIIDATGRVVSSFWELPARPIDLSDRAWFRAHRDEGADLVISEALQSRVTGGIMFIMTRAIRAADGSLLGIVNLGVPSESLIGEHALPYYGDGVVLMLLKPDGSLLARNHFPPELLGTRVPVEGATDGQTGLLRHRPLDGRTVVRAVDIEPTYGMIAIASIPVAEVFRPLLVVTAIGLPLLLLMVWGVVHLMRSLDRGHRLLTRAHARLQAVLDASHLGAWHLDVPSQRSEMNARWAEIVGHDPSEIGTRIDEWTRRLHPEEKAQVLAAIEEALSGKTPVYHLEHRMRHKDGHYVWVLDSGCVVERDAEGRPILMTGTLLDISERRETEQRIRVLMREMDHRAKNLLAVVYSLINLMKADDLPAFKEALLGRVQALGHVHSLLSRNAWDGVELGQLVATETAAYHSDTTPRIDAQGPGVTLRPAAAQAVAMIVHELMTNSAKYGALSAQSGLVRFDWRIDEDRDVHLTWEESGGPHVAPPARRGFGATLLNTMIKDQLDGTVTAHWRRHGARFEFCIPAHNLVPVAAQQQTAPLARRATA